MTGIHPLQGFLAAACVIAAPATAQTAPSFTGTWKGDPASAKLPTKPDVFELKNGRFSCSSCVPAVSVKADGTPQAASGHDYWDHIAVKATDPRTISYTYYRKGKVTSESTDTVSADGNTLTSSWRSNDNAKGIQQSGTGTETRVAPAAAGAHAASGSWKQAAIEAISESNLLITLKDNGEGLMLSLPSGESYDAKFGGAAVPIVGDPAGTTAKVRRVNATTIEETDMRGGKVVYVYLMTLAPDGKSMTIVNDDRKRGTKTEVVAYRQ